MAAEGRGEIRTARAGQVDMEEREELEAGIEREQNPSTGLDRGRVRETRQMDGGGRRMPGGVRCC